jgi:hypothetical protein
MDANLLDSRGNKLGEKSNKTALDVAGLSRPLLERRSELANDMIDRIYRGLFVYSVGIDSTGSRLMCSSAS